MQATVIDDHQIASAERDALLVAISHWSLIK
jgi:hypothetical protein